MYRFLIIVLALSALWGGGKDFVVVEKDQQVRGDFFATASVIEISGHCLKDVYLAGTQILIDGVIEGDLICLAGSLQITGVVKGALRGVVGQSLIAGSVEKNTTLASAAFTATPTARFNSNLFLAASTADLAGTLLQNLFVGASNIRYSARTLENLYLYAGTIRINSKASVGGFLEYSSPAPIDIHQGAQIKGGVIQKEGASNLYSKSVLFNKLMVGSKLTAVLMNFFFTLMIGIALIKLWPNAFMRSLHNLKHHFLKCMMHGLLFLIAIPLLGLLLLITILGIPIAVTLIAFSVLGLYTAKIHVLYYLAERFKARTLKKWGVISIYTVLCLGYFILQLIPYLDMGLSAVATLAGLGASVYLPKVIKKS